MLVQRLRVDQATDSGLLVIESGNQNLAELAALAEELKGRANMRTEGSIITTPPAEPVVR